MNKIIIERDKLEHNIHVIKDKIKDLEHKPKIIAVIKGNGYGMGAELIAQKLIDFNVDFFAVSEISEAKVLREAGFNNDILLLESTCIESEAYEIVKYNLIASVGSIKSIEILNEEARKAQKIVEAHLKIDTGFGRFGFVVNEEVSSNLKLSLDNAKNIRITGTYSHFAQAYENDNRKTKQQYDNFISNIKVLNQKNINTGMLHICNTSAFFKYPDMYLDAVRIGSAFTGRVQIKEATGLKRLGYLETEICEIRELKQGSTIGYSGTCKLKRDTVIAVAEAGYEAGVGVSGPKDMVRFIDKLRNIKNSMKSLTKDERLFVEINDKKCPIMGRIGMKNFMVDITECDAKIGDKIKVPINLILANSNIKRQEL